MDMLKQIEEKQLNDEVCAMARAGAKLAMQALLDELRDGTGIGRVRAAALVLERGLGKTTQALAMEGQLDVEPVLPEEALNVLDGLYLSLMR